MEGLEARLVEFYSPQTDTLRMRQLEQELHEFRKRPDALQLALQFLERSSSPYVQWFCAMILEVSALNFVTNMYGPLYCLGYTFC